MNKKLFLFDLLNDPDFIQKPTDSKERFEWLKYVLKCLKQMLPFRQIFITEKNCDNYSWSIIEKEFEKWAHTEAFANFPQYHEDEGGWEKAIAEGMTIQSFELLDALNHNYYVSPDGSLFSESTLGSVPEITLKQYVSSVDAELESLKEIIKNYPSDDEEGKKLLWKGSIKDAILFIEKLKEENLIANTECNILITKLFMFYNKKEQTWFSTSENTVAQTKGRETKNRKTVGPQINKIIREIKRDGK